MLIDTDSEMLNLIAFAQALFPFIWTNVVHKYPVTIIINSGL